MRPNRCRNFEEVFIPVRIRLGVSPKVDRLVLLQPDNFSLGSNLHASLDDFGWLAPLRFQLTQLTDWKAGQQWTRLALLSILIYLLILGGTSLPVSTPGKFVHNTFLITFSFGI